MTKPPRRALAVVDVQGEYFDGPLAIRHPPAAEALDAIIAAVHAAHRAGVPVALIQHENPASAVVFAAGSERQRLHPRLTALSEAPVFTKDKASIFASSAFAAWLQRHRIDTVTLVGFMANNCLLASAAAAEALDVDIEVLSDASGSIGLANDAGQADARQVHETLMALLHSNWAAVADVGSWQRAVARGLALEKSNLVASACGRTATSDPGRDLGPERTELT
ncbi:MAG: isochorismatase family protein [Actinomycetaceae bacterium]|nr:isochorismatase family protein [Actinomycetaceae bacterium]